MRDVTRILSSIEAGDPRAAEELLPLLYHELRRIAAATNIQDAVDAAADGDTVLVTNGVYATGGKSLDGTTTNRMAVDKPLDLLSVNGPAVTVIDGLATFRCVTLATNARLTGFTLTDGFAPYGGGVLGGTLTNCILNVNTALAVFLGGAGEAVPGSIRTGRKPPIVAPAGLCRLAEIDCHRAESVADRPA
jgi:hypothetical protein